MNFGPSRLFDDLRYRLVQNLEPTIPREYILKGVVYACLGKYNTIVILMTLSFYNFNIEN
jgi:hypothetical protein